jgi:hypothetical protein
MKKISEDNSQSCGSCRFLTRHKTFEVPCINNGKISTSKSCSSHSPDVFNLVNSPQEKNTLQELAKTLVHMSPSQLLVLSELCKHERKTRKKGFYLMQRVYVRIQGNKNYFSNFVEAYVLMAEKNQILLVDEGCGHHWYLDFDKKLNDSLYTESQFTKLREEMIENRAFIDPEIANQKRKLESAKLAKALNLQEAESAGLGPKKKKSRKDLFDIAQKISRGYIRKSARDSFDEDDEVEVKIEHDL